MPAGTADLVVARVAVAITPQPTYPDAQIEFCAAPTFFALLGRHLRDQVVPDCSAGILVTGDSTDVVFRLHNFADRAVTAPVGLTGPAGTTVTGPATVTVPARGNTRIAFTVGTPAGAAVAATDRLRLTVGAGADAREWAWLPERQEVGYREAAEVGVELGTTNTGHGVRQVDIGFDGLTVAGTTAGRGYRASKLQHNGFTDEDYLYFDVDDTFLVDADGAEVVVEVDYLDEPGLAFRLDYDALDGARMLDGVHTPTPAVHTAGTGAWATATFPLSRVAFANRISGSPDGRAVGQVDFRIASAAAVKIAAVRVRKA